MRLTFFAQQFDVCPLNPLFRLIFKQFSAKPNAKASDAEACRSAFFAFVLRECGFLLGQLIFLQKNVMISL
jgi:hypothetical protein